MRRLACLGLVVLTAACGGDDDDDDVVVVDAAVEMDAQHVDAFPMSTDAAGPAFCTTFGPWSSPTPVTEVNTADPENGPSLSADGLTLYFSRYETDVWKVYRATRLSPEGSFGVPVPVDEINVAGQFRHTALARDGLEIYVTSGVCQPAERTDDIWVAKRSSTTEPFGTPENLTTLNSTECDARARLSPDGLTLYWASFRAPNLGGFDMWRATRPDKQASFGAPAPVVELNTDESDGALTLSHDGLVAYFSSRRSGGMGSSDLMTAERAEPHLAFGAPVFVTELNSTGEETDGWLSLDGLSLYVSSTRAGGRDIWVATRTCADAGM